MQAKEPAASADRPQSQTRLMLGYFALAAVLALAMAMLTPPFQVPDEHQHFFRAFALSEGGITAETRKGQAGDMLPASLGELADAELGSRLLHVRIRPVRAFPARETLAALKIPLDPDRREFLDFTGAAAYSPLGYFPQIAGIALGRTLDLGPLPQLYLARIFNALAAVVLVVGAIYAMPFGKVLMAGAGLLPMTLYMFGSASPDASVISSALLFAALSARAMVLGGWAGRDLAVACCCAAVFCTVKPPYAPLLLLALPAALRPGAAKNMLMSQAAILVVGFGSAAAWLALFAPNVIAPREGVDAAAQINALLANPGRDLAILDRTLHINAYDWSAEIVGKFGWLSILPTDFMYWGAGVALLIAFVAQDEGSLRIRPIEAIWAALTATGCALAVITTLAVVWNPVGLEQVRGVQGRYFLPIIGALFIAFAAIRPPGSHLGVYFRAVAMILAAAVSVAGVHLVASSYGVFG